MPLGLCEFNSAPKYLVFFFVVFANVEKCTLIIEYVMQLLSKIILFIIPAFCPILQINKKINSLNQLTKCENNNYP